jgi:glutathione S-transferase
MAESDAFYTIYGGLGSPYSMKMRAVLRYRRLPYVWKQMGAGDDAVFQHVKAPVIPVIRYPTGEWRNDSTPMIFELERRHAARSIVPADEADAFLAHLLEDMADEWGTKAMFHYRWFRDRDQKQMSEWLAFDRLRGRGLSAVMKAAEAFRERQVARMALVGCTPQNAPLIEETARRILALFEAHVTEEPFLFGTRPSLADFGWFGQLSQLANDPTSAELMRDTAPFTYRWLMNLDDASGVEGDWRGAAAPSPAAVEGLLRLAGEVYFPFLLANAKAMEAGAATFQFKALDMTYEQGAFKYQARCLADLRRAFAALSPAGKARVAPVLRRANCLAALAA